MKSIHTKSTSKCLAKAQPDEPIFAIVARDPSAHATIMAWVEKNKGIQPEAKLQEAIACALECSNWYNAHFGDTATKRRYFCIDGRLGPFTYSVTLHDAQPLRLGSYFDKLAQKEVSIYLKPGDSTTINIDAIGMQEVNIGSYYIIDGAFVENKKHVGTYMLNVTRITPMK